MEYLHIPKASHYNADSNEDSKMKEYHVSLLSGFWEMSYNADVEYGIITKCIMYYLENENVWKEGMEVNKLRFESKWLQKWIREVCKFIIPSAC